VPVVKGRFKEFYAARVFKRRRQMRTPTSNFRMRTIQGVNTLATHILTLLNLCCFRQWWFDVLGCKLSVKMALRERDQTKQPPQAYSWGSKTWGVKCVLRVHCVCARRSEYLAACCN
jgi:hypothetical protein